jgi:hypothetical protein
MVGCRNTSRANKMSQYSLSGIPMVGCRNKTVNRSPARGRQFTVALRAA